MTYIDKSLELAKVYFDADKAHSIAIELNTFTKQIGDRREDARKEYHEFLQHMIDKNINPYSILPLVPTGI